MKILFGIHYYLPRRTGMQLYVQRLAEALNGRGHEVTVLTTRHSRELPRRETIGGVQVHRLSPLPPRISRGYLTPGLPIAAWRLVENADIVSLHTPMWEASIVARIAAARRKPIVITHHGDVVLPGGAVDRVIERVMLSLFRDAGRRASKVIAYSDDYTSHSNYLRSFPEKVIAVAPPVRMPAPRLEKVRELRLRWAPEGGPVIGFAGRFVREKRPDVLVRALDALTADHPNVRIVFAGETDTSYENTRASLEGLIRERRSRLRFLGTLGGEQEMADFYGACDVLALPSETECFGLVQPEAMLCGTPVVASNVPGCRTAVETTGMGELAEAGDAESLAAALSDVLADPERYRRPRADIEAAYDFSACIDRYEQLFAEAAWR